MSTRDEFQPGWYWRIESPLAKAKGCDYWYTQDTGGYEFTEDHIDSIEGEGSVKFERVYLDDAELDEIDWECQ